MLHPPRPAPDSLPGLRLLFVPDLRLTPTSAPSGPPLLLLSASGTRITAGPLFIPGVGVCPGCVAFWAHTAAQGIAAAPEPSPKTSELLNQIAQDVSVALAAGNPPQPLLRGLWEIDAATAQRVYHFIVPRADCLHCASLDRSAFPLHAHCSPLTGILSSVSVTAAELVGSFSAIARFVPPLPRPHTRSLVEAQFSLGKGHSREQAIESCIGEALERYSIVYTGSEDVVRARISDPPAVDPREILLVSDHQYDTRDSWNATRHYRYWIPERFDESRPIDLLAATDLLSHATVYVPAACCLMWYAFPPGEPHFASADSNGCGAGTTLAAAAESALLELVERDALAIWWYNQVPRPAVSLESFASPVIERIRTALALSRRGLYLLNISTELNIPTYVALSPSEHGGEPLFAAAAALSPRHAAEKAIAEVAQLLFSALHTGAIDPELHAWLGAANLATHRFLAPLYFSPAPPEPETFSSQARLAECVRRLGNAGLRPILVDHSRPEVLLKTVRAIIPGLRHIWARFAPGRLYTVPARQGWLNEPVTEENLNSILCMI